MSAEQILSTAVHWLKQGITLLLLLAIVAVLLQGVIGVNLPYVRELTPERLAYLAGAYWLTR